MKTDVEENDPLLDSLNVQYGSNVTTDAATDVNANQVLESTSLPHDTNSVLSEILDTLSLAIPIFCSSVSWVGMKTTDTALLGHVGPTALSAAALSDLYTMCSGVLVQGRVLGILVSQSMGADNPLLAGIYLRVSLLVLSMLLVPVIVAWLFTGKFWQYFGEPASLYDDAQYYSTVLAVALPAMVFSSQLSQFFSAQRIMHPEVNASLLGLVANLLLGLVLVLGVGVQNFEGFGFEACPIVTSSVVYIKTFFMWFVYCHVQGLHLPCWGKNSLVTWKDEITKERVKTFSKLYFPSALSMASDFWRMGVVGGMAASLGDDEVGVFNASYRIFWMCLILSGAIANAVGIKIGIAFGAGNSIGAKRSASIGLGLAFGVLVLVAALISINIELIGSIFTSDPILLKMFEEMKWPFVIGLFFMNLAVVIEQIPMSMGRTDDIFYAGFVASWLGQVPAVYICITYWRNDLSGLYTGVAIGYIFLTCVYACMTFTSDFAHYANMALKRVEKSL
mmetsp:Transcript_13453/g.17617  ORF Transcript_13453/g.17617 Transcript_13453/m.17617 type:complete len:506 (+) Transcript_13453:155-1672(+)